MYVIYIETNEISNIIISRDAWIITRSILRLAHRRDQRAELDFRARAVDKHGKTNRDFCPEIINVRAPFLKRGSFS